MNEIQRTLIVTGMHRSGTSLVAHYLQGCGLPMGERLLAADSGNPLGYFEDTDFLEFHRRILKKNNIPTFLTTLQKFPIQFEPEDWQSALEIIAAKAHLDFWGFKEPRTSLFLDFWLELLKKPRFLFLFRHPLQVWNSLIARGTDGDINRYPIIALKAWKIYNQKILDFFQSHSNISLVINISRFIQAPQTYIRHLTQKFQLNLPATCFDNIFVQNRFQSRFPSTRVLRSAGLHPVDVYECLILYNRLQEISTQLTERS